MPNSIAICAAICVSVALISAPGNAREQVPAPAHNADIIKTVSTSEQAELIKNPHVRKGLNITTSESSVTIEPGECKIGGKVVGIKKSVILSSEPAPDITVIDEPLRLSAQTPSGFFQGTRLPGPNALDINAMHSYIPGSLIVRRAPGGEPLTAGKDYLVSDDYGMVGCGPAGSITPDDTVYVSYKYSLMRLDSIDISPKGEVVMTAGKADITIPVPPALKKGWLRLANVYRPYRKADIDEDDIYVIGCKPGAVKTGTTPGRIPKTLAKLKAGKDVTIVCLGDSVTAGGNASAPEKRYVDVFAAGLKKRFPKARVNVINVSVGGSISLQWLYPDQYKGSSGTDFARVVEAKPDLVTVEFVNDAGLDTATFTRAYMDMIGRFSAIGAECIFITPHFTNPAWMNFSSMRGRENRQYVMELKKFANNSHIAIADASARWENLWREGIPYLTLLHNSVNHPDDRGHLMFAEELWKCFE